MKSLFADELSALGKTNDLAEPDTFLEESSKKNRDEVFSTWKGHGVIIPAQFGIHEDVEAFNTSNYDKQYGDLSAVFASNSEDVPKLRAGVVRPSSLSGGSVIALQKWEGHVMELSGESFTARLVDLTDKDGKEDAEFMKSQLSDDDLQLLEPGAVFYWTIGRQTDSTNRQRTISEIRFRRLPKWTLEEIDQAAAQAIDLAARFGIE